MFESKTPRARIQDDEHEQGYYAPMADLLAGILFVILVLLMSFAIIHYPDSRSAPVSPLTPADAARKSERSVAAMVQPTEPEVDVRVRLLHSLEAERARLLNGIMADLIAEGIPASVDLQQSQILVDERAFFRPGESRLTFVGERNAKAIGTILVRRLTCYVGPCSEEGPARVEGIFLDVSAEESDLTISSSTINDPRAFAAARALVLMKAFADGDLSILQLRNSVGAPLVHASGRVKAGSGRVVLSVALAPVMEFLEQQVSPTDSKDRK